MTQFHIQALESALIGFGLTPKQAKVYLAALQLGTSSVQQIAEKARIERTNAYDAIQALIDRRLLSITTIGKKRLFVAEAPEMLASVLEEKAAQLEAALPELRALYNASPTKPKVQFYPGAEGCKAVIETMLVESKGSEIMAMVPPDDLVKTLGGDYAAQAFERFVKMETNLKIIFCQQLPALNILPASSSANCKIKLAPQEIEFPVATFIYGHRTIFLSLTGELFGLTIESVGITEAETARFANLWEGEGTQHF